MTSFPQALALPTALRQKLPMLVTYAGSMASLLIGSIAQLLTFAILARGLGSQQFGLLMAITAATNLAVQFCGLGATETMVRRVARDPAIYRVALGHNLILMAMSGGVMVVGFMAVMPVFFQVSPTPALNILALFSIVFTNVVLVRWILLTEQIFIAHSAVRNANFANLGFALARTAGAAVACIGFKVDRVEDWAFWHGGGHLVTAGFCWLALRHYGRPRWRIMREEVKLGVYFSTPYVFQALRQNADFLVLSAVVSHEVIGSYSMARRIVDTSVLTVTALYRLSYPKLARASEHGLRAAVPLISGILVSATAIAVVTSIGVYFTASFMPRLFGRDFGDMVPYLHVMCWAMILVTFQNVAAETLGASGRHRIRAAVFNAGCLIGSATAAILSYVFLLSGTFAAIYIVEGALAIAFWVILIRIIQREQVAALKTA